MVNALNLMKMEKGMYLKRKVNGILVLAKWFFSFDM